jgi:hypothetical protein
MLTCARFFCLLAVLALGGSLRAADPVRLTSASVGFPIPNGAPTDSLAKFGAWAPVYVSFELLEPLSEPVELVAETPDPDEINTAFAVELDVRGTAPGALFASDRGAIPYVRLSGSASEVTLTVRTKAGKALSEPLRVRTKVREPLQYVVLALGGVPAGFELPKPVAVGGVEPTPLRNGRVELAHIADFTKLPDHWTGYDGADLVVLCTASASDNFLNRLFGADAKRREALLEWVRRGGRLVVSVGEKAKRATELAELQQVLPFAVNPTNPGRAVSSFPLQWAADFEQKNATNATLAVSGGTVALAHLVPHTARAARVVSPPPGSRGEPVAAQATLGLGRVTVVAFDLDRMPFADAEARSRFWDWVLRVCGSQQACAGGDGKPRPPGALTEDEDEAAVALRQHNDAFEGVAVVSFGWIALLIAAYILLVGPVEYFVLKRVFGRLELTWVTLPVIVLTVCVVAYLAADSVKGRELKVNKIDVVDVDAGDGRVYGTSWATVFSPRIDNYSVAFTPNDGWGAAEPGTAVNALGAPRGGRPGLVRRSYDIRPEGLDRVPVQVWSTKPFGAQWSARGARVKSDLFHPAGDRTAVAGTFTHNLPVLALSECVAFYAGQAHALTGDVLVRGEPVRLVLQNGLPAGQWMRSQRGQLEPLLSGVQAYAERPGQKSTLRGVAQPYSGPIPLWAVLFHESALKNEDGVFARNASLRRLDQSWRLSEFNTDEVIVVGRAVVPPTAAETALSGPESPTKLWLKALPGTGDRPAIVGTGRQETWVRFYLPIK